ncbi:hypothetical protein BDQ17DRAFT_1430982 [Cyathus striatus]|nr:hypothetical protein BDQ17DRAFT_1430982 [Cyathus striatus]
MSSTEGKGRIHLPEETLPLYTDSSLCSPTGDVPSSSLLLDNDKNNKAEHEVAKGTTSKMSCWEWVVVVGTFLIASAVRAYRLDSTVHAGVRYSTDTKALPKLLAMLTDMLPGSRAGQAADGRPHVTVARLLIVILGSLTIPFSYLSTRLLDCRPSTALLVSLFLTFDNGLIVQSRYILPDTILFFFTVLSFFFWFGFSKRDQRQPFSRQWWTWLMLTGLSLGAVISCKLTGMLTAATIAVGVAYQLWNLKDSSERMRHFKARALCLIVVPVLFYLITSQMYDVASGGKVDYPSIDVSIGSTVTIKPYNTGRGYLHSYKHFYPGGSEQQQVTLYPKAHADNKWLITNTSSAMEVNYKSTSLPFTRIYHNTPIRLRHINTHKHLHSHDIHPYESKSRNAYEVTGYGLLGFAGDANDDWIVDIVNGDRGGRGTFSRILVRTQKTVVTFRHERTGCYLYSNGEQLPEWGFGQLEVTCKMGAGFGMDGDRNALWYFETSDHPAQPEPSESDFSVLPQWYIEYFGISADALARPPPTSNMKASESWLFLLNRGVDFRVTANMIPELLFVLNPVVWWLSSFAVISYAVAIVALISRARRGHNDFDNPKVTKFITTGGYLFVGWALHYFPFLIGHQKLFIYDYFPGLYLAILLLFTSFDMGTATLQRKVRIPIVLGLLCLVLWGYSRLMVYTYGTP